mgnify:CR=1 FL=1
MTTSLSSFRKDVWRYAPEVPGVTVDDHVLKSVREFCDKTLVWRQDLASRISVVADTYEYAVTAPTGTDVIGLHRVMYKQAGEDDDQFGPLEPMTEDGMDRTHQTGQWRYTEAKQPSKFLYAIGGNIRLIPIPTVASASGLLITAYCKPLITATTVQDFFYTRYLDVIVKGAVYRLLDIPKKPWADIELSKMIEAEFNSMCGSASFENQYSGRTTRKTRIKLSSQLR